METSLTLVTHSSSVLYNIDGEKLDKNIFFMTKLIKELSFLLCFQDLEAAKMGSEELGSRFARMMVSIMQSFYRLME